jgi:hypothetical protein
VTAAFKATRRGRACVLSSVPSGGGGRIRGKLGDRAHSRFGARARADLFGLDAEAERVVGADHAET